MKVKNALFGIEHQLKDFDYKIIKSNPIWIRSLLNLIQRSNMELINVINTFTLIIFTLQTFVFKGFLIEINILF